jgi:hypothetical protein
LRVAPVQDPIVKKECGACHNGLSRRIVAGAVVVCDDSVPCQSFRRQRRIGHATTRQIAEYLTANAADAVKDGRKITRDLDPKTVPARITDLPTWKRKYEKRDRVSAATLARNGAKFKGDCKACHKEAERGIFEDDD